MSEVIKQKLIDLVTDPLKSEGYELASVSVATFQARATVRLYLYGENGVPLDECARLSTLVGGLVEHTDLFATGYRLEISSPGLDRPLTNELDFRYRVGETVKVAFADPERQSIEAKILGVSANTVQLAGESGTLACDIADIEQAQIVY